jgi:hypothetical protein
MNIDDGMGNAEWCALNHIVAPRLRIEDDEGAVCVVAGQSGGLNTAPLAFENLVIQPWTPAPRHAHHKELAGTFDVLLAHDVSMPVVDVAGGGWRAPIVSVDDGRADLDGVLCIEWADNGRLEIPRCAWSNPRAFVPGVFLDAALREGDVMDVVTRGGSLGVAILPLRNATRVYIRYAAVSAQPAPPLRVRTFHALRMLGIRAQEVPRAAVSIAIDE